ncbi:MAG: AI-2E family transporter YdiK [Sulfurifustaceae bacterium]
MNDIENRQGQGVDAPIRPPQKSGSVVPAQPYDLTRVVLTVLFSGALISASFWVLRPFLGATIWAIMIVVATWPMMSTIQKFAGGRRWVAVAIMSIILVLLLIVPLAAAIGTIIANIDDIIEWANRVRTFKLPPAPSWLASLPVVGTRAAELWQNVAAQGVEVLAAKIAPYTRALASWFVSEIGSLGVLFLQLLLTVIAAAILYAGGEGAARWTLRFGARLGGQRGEAVVHLSGQAIRSVARGVVVTAVVQTLIGGIGLWIAGVPFAAVLTALMFFLAIAQIGAALVLIVPVIWLYSNGSAGWGTFLLIVTVIAATLDNVLRPILIKQGAANLPLLLIFVGVIGGLIAFGLIGIFIGPLVLAVTYTLVNAWIEEGLP